tara:strand:- start:75 stop:518 length:444 start_codon:yes stop_codon:yes gene_type:complete
MKRKTGKVYKKSPPKQQKVKHPHRNKYEGGSHVSDGKISEPRDSYSESSGNCDYFGIRVNNNVIKVYSKSSESFIKSLLYNPNEESMYYKLAVNPQIDSSTSAIREKTSLVSGQTIDEFFDLAIMDEKGKKELIVIKKLLEDLVDLN